MNTSWITSKIGRGGFLLLKYLIMAVNITYFNISVVQPNAIAAVIEIGIYFLHIPRIDTTITQVRELQNSVVPINLKR